MNLKKIIISILILFVVTNCSETNGIFGKTGSGSDEDITLTITDAVGNVTTMSVPLGDFQF